jgi:uncharacterized protein (TIGR03382 family)
MDPGLVLVISIPAAVATAALAVVALWIRRRRKR